MRREQVSANNLTFPRNPPWWMHQNRNCGDDFITDNVNVTEQDYRKNSYHVCGEIIIVFLWWESSKSHMRKLSFTSEPASVGIGILSGSNPTYKSCFYCSVSVWGFSNICFFSVRTVPTYCLEISQNSSFIQSKTRWKTMFNVIFNVVSHWLVICLLAICRVSLSATKLNDINKSSFGFCVIVYFLSGKLWFCCRILIFN